MIMTFLVIHGLVCDRDAYWSFMDWFVIMMFSCHSSTGLWPWLYSSAVYDCDVSWLYS